MQKRTGPQLFKRTVLLITALVTVVASVNLLLTIPQTREKAGLLSEAELNIAALNSTGAKIELTTESSYKFNKQAADADLQAASQLKQQTDILIRSRLEELTALTQVSGQDLLSLDAQSRNLHLATPANEAIKGVSAFSTPREQVSGLSRELDRLQEEITATKGLITDYQKAQQSKGEFSNPLWGKTDSELKQMVNAMTNKEKAAQLFIWGISSTQLSAAEASQLTKIAPAGIILMGYNIANATQLKALTRQLQATNTQIPFYIATDQEGGMVKRVSWDNTAGQKSWASLDDKSLCALAESRTRTLLSSGINLNFSPVTDLSFSEGSFINNRTISSDPQVVLGKTSKYIECSQALGISTTIKHFPGHGATTEDSHYYLPVINKTKAEWLKSDAIPITGNLSSKFLMVGHLKFSNIDPINPASTSRILVTDILKQEFGYKGLVITDDMNQLQRSSGISTKATVTGALNAGVDIILYVGLPESPDKITDIVSRAITDKELNAAEIDAKVLHILSAKRDLHY